jgi:hypothetical protein
MFVSGQIAVANIFLKCCFEECYRCDTFIFMYDSLVKTRKGDFCISYGLACLVASST